MNIEEKKAKISQRSTRTQKHHHYFLSILLKVTDIKNIFNLFLQGLLMQTTTTRNTTN